MLKPLLQSCSIIMYSLQSCNILMYCEQLSFSEAYLPDFDSCTKHINYWQRWTPGGTLKQGLPDWTKLDTFWSLQMLYMVFYYVLLQIYNFSSFIFIFDFQEMGGGGWRGPLNQRTVALWVPTICNAFKVSSLHIHYLLQRALLVNTMDKSCMISKRLFCLECFATITARNLLLDTMLW